jgi:hypothetical protein
MEGVKRGEGGGGWGGGRLTGYLYVIELHRSQPFEDGNPRVGHFCVLTRRGWRVEVGGECLCVQQEGG